MNRVAGILTRAEHRRRCHIADAGRGRGVGAIHLFEMVTESGESRVDTCGHRGQQIDQGLAGRETYRLDFISVSSFFRWPLQDAVGSRRYCYRIVRSPRVVHRSVHDSEHSHGDRRLRIRAMDIVEGNVIPVRRDGIGAGQGSGTQQYQHGAQGYSYSTNEHLPAPDGSWNATSRFSTWHGDAERLRAGAGSGLSSWWGAFGQPPPTGAKSPN